MNKNEAATFLGVSLRTLERYGAEKKITPTIKRTPKGRAADYSEADLIRLKAELAGETDSTPTEAVATSPTGSDRMPSDSANTLALSGDSFQEVSPPQADSLPTAAIVPASRQGAAIVAAKMPPNIPTQDASFVAFNREALTIADAVIVSSLPENRIRAALRDKMLKGKLIGRSWRIGRSDLDDWIRQLLE